MTRPAVAAGLVVVALAGCSASRDDPAPATTPAATARDPAHTHRARGQRLQPSHCPAGLAGCRTARGRIIYVERVDPDGDGDAHFVLDSRESVTLPGISVIDVEKSRRPSPLPNVGDRMSAAGPAARGSYGQTQIEAIELHWVRSR
jgi:hypothetical protein